MELFGSTGRANHRVFCVCFVQVKLFIKVILLTMLKRHISDAGGLVHDLSEEVEMERISNIRNIPSSSKLGTSHSSES